MQITLALKCLRCRNFILVKNRKKHNGSYNYFGNQRGLQLVSYYEKNCRESSSWIVPIVNIMPVRGTGDRE